MIPTRIRVVHHTVGHGIDCSLDFPNIAYGAGKVRAMFRVKHIFHSRCQILELSLGLSMVFFFFFFFFFFWFFF
jgi:hypothetical protein